MSLQVTGDCLTSFQMNTNNILVVGKFIIGNNFEDTTKATDFFSSLREDEIEKAAQIFQKLPKYLQIYCINLRSNGTTLLHKLVLRYKNTTTLKTLKIFFPKFQKKYLTELKDRSGWTILDYANQNQNDYLLEKFNNILNRKTT
ncbi:MAG: hypothetical protein KR126chlam4_00044 [Candidatus Anoxychlamydiales bacterium]|uniref:Uncharacterized protein n=1 Tax=marine sediment metagenome TaxID=412755 RepID=A0A0F9LEC9_9ZZZZ|nr:hypothetical protein [Candidatus Anoxychlamydiales bacterium]NGX40227.1 hypothetical protein [Candidatus Anoxychlamydiales bacterium]HEU64127.1 hypothetical protein [Chlamydiota bacterium]